MRRQMTINKDEIIQLTKEYGGEWGLSHTQRILHLISVIDEGKEYDKEALWIAAHLHDWGGYKKWAKPGIDHATRSAEVAGNFMRERSYSDTTMKLVLECISTHHSGGKERSFEAILLSDADGLDFLGAIGIFRDISKNTKELRKGYEIIKKRMQNIPNLLCIEQSKEIAKDRIIEMNNILNAFEGSSFGYY